MGEGKTNDLESKLEERELSNQLNETLLSLLPDYSHADIKIDLDMRKIGLMSTTGYSKVHIPVSVSKFYIDVIKRKELEPLRKGLRFMLLHEIGHNPNLYKHFRNELYPTLYAMVNSDDALEAFSAFIAVVGYASALFNMTLLKSRGKDIDFATAVYKCRPAKIFDGYLIKLGESTEFPLKEGAKKTILKRSAYYFKLIENVFANSRIVFYTVDFSE